MHVQVCAFCCDLAHVLSTRSRVAIILVMMLWSARGLQVHVGAYARTSCVPETDHLEKTGMVTPRRHTLAEMSLYLLAAPFARADAAASL